MPATNTRPETPPQLSRLGPPPSARPRTAPLAARRLRRRRGAFPGRGRGRAPHRGVAAAGHVGRARFRVLPPPESVSAGAGGRCNRCRHLLLPVPAPLLLPCSVLLCSPALLLSCVCRRPPAVRGAAHTRERRPAERGLPGASPNKRRLGPVSCLQAALLGEFSSAELSSFPPLQCVVVGTTDVKFPEKWSPQ